MLESTPSPRVETPSPQVETTTLDELQALEKQCEKLELKKDVLSNRYDPDAGSYMEDQPWYAEYSAIGEEISTLVEQIDKHEAAVMANENRQFLSPVVDGKIREPREFAWDHWQQWVIEDGVTEELSHLGRSVIREAYQHSWSDELKAECGWSDDGEAMILLAKEDPDRARIRWQYLLESDGDFGWK